MRQLTLSRRDERGTEQDRKRRREREDVHTRVDVENGTELGGPMHSSQMPFSTIKMTDAYEAMFV